MANQLSTAKRTKILHLLLEGTSMRSICRVEGVSWEAVDKLLNDAAQVCRRHHRRKVKGVRAERIQCDELWSFCYAKQKNVTKAVAAPDAAGDVWTWTGIEATSKLLISYKLGDRSDRTCRLFMKDLSSRVLNTRHLTICTDGNASYVKAIRRYFGRSVSYSQLVKDYSGGEVGTRSRQVFGKHSTDKASTSYVERLNLTIRMSSRRYTRKTNGFSKTLENHKNTFHLFATYYNFVRVHQTLGTTPAVAAGLAKKPYSLEWIIRRIDRRAPKPQRPKVYRKLCKV